MANVVKTRNIAANNLVQVKQSSIIAFVKANMPDYTSESPQAAFIANNRLTVTNVEYYAVNDEDGVTLIPVTIHWTYQQDMATQADKIALSKLEATVKPFKMLFDMGEITKEQFDNMTCVLVDLGELERLRTICADGASETKWASAWLCDNLIPEDILGSVKAFVSEQK